jgi:succinyl-diaminopimelate desuccinylase
MWRDDELKKLFKRIDSLRREMINAQIGLTAIPALSPINKGEGEVRKAEYVKKIIKPIGFDEIKEFRAPDKGVPCGYRPNLVAKLKGRDHRRTIWIMSHLDVVPPGTRSLWKSDPYKVVEKNGKLYGRGTEDNQQAVVSSIYAVKAMKDLNLTPEYNVGLVFIADEETGSEFGISYLLKKYSLFGKKDIIIIPDAGNSNSTMMEVAEKSILWLKITTKGKQCHASTPQDGINAHRAAAHLLCRLDEVLHKRFKVKDRIFNPPVSTFEPTKKEANVENVNTIPGEDVFYFDCRVMPQYKIEAVQKLVKDESAKIEKEFGVKISFKPVQSAQAAPPTKPDAPVVKMLERAIRHVTGRRPKTVGIGGGTLAAHFRKKGYDAVVWSTVDGICHQPNEYCVIDHMLTDTKIFAYLFGYRA